MRIITIIFLCLFSLILMFSNGEEVMTSYYNPVRKQCYGNPLITADGSKINLTKLKSGYIRWVAISRDLLKSGYNMGDTIEVECDHKFFQGKWVIRDKMGKRSKNRIDFLLHPHTKEYPPRRVKIKKL